MKEWPVIEKHPLSADLKALPCIEAEPWIKVGEGHVRPAVEGVSCDIQGNVIYCVRFHPGSCVFRAYPDGHTEEVYRNMEADMIGTAVHSNGDIYVADIHGHKLFILSPDGKVKRELFSQFSEYSFDPNDLCINKRGDVFFTNFTGTAFAPTGGVYRLDAADDYTTIHKVIGGLAAPNGVGLTPDESKLWISETAKNEVFKLKITPDGNMMDFPFAQTSFYRATGYEMFDSLKVDSADNCYIAVMYGGRVLVLNTDGVPVGNIIIPGREEGKYMFSANVGIKPGTKEGFVIASGVSGSWLFKFPTIAEGPVF